jgi:hypothetical protein
MFSYIKSWIPGLKSNDNWQDNNYRSSRSMETNPYKGQTSNRSDCGRAPYHPHSAPNITGASMFETDQEKFVHYNSLAGQEDVKANLAPFTFLYRLTALWFITVAAGSVVWSIPIGAIGLPIIIGLGIVTLIISFITSIIIRFWIFLLKSSWGMIRSVLDGPFLIAKKILKQFTGMDLTTSPRSIDQLEKGPLVINETPMESSNFSGSQRRFSSSSRLTERSIDPTLAIDTRWRYYEPSVNDTSSNYSNVGPSSPRLNALTSPSLYSDMSRRLEDFDQHLSIHPRVVNASFYELHREQRDRMEMCAQLYSLTTNVPMDQFELHLGRREDTGNTHHILSLWNEPSVNEPLELSHLIGFCEVSM